MSRNQYQKSFSYFTHSIDERMSVLNSSNVTISNEFNLIYYPYKEIKKIEFKKLNITDEQSTLQYYLFKQSYYSLILKYILHFEVGLKEAVSYVIGTEYGDYTSRNDKSLNIPNDYLNINNYNKNKQQEDVELILNKLKSLVIKPQAYCENIINFERRSNLPPYVLASDLMFSTIIDWYYILEKQDAINVIRYITQQNFTDKEMVLILQFFTRATRLLRETRNNYAHNNSNGKYSQDNYKGITYNDLKIIFKDTSFELAISKNKYNNYIRNSPQSVANICLISLLDETSRVNFLREFILLFENHCEEYYFLNKNEMIEDLHLKEFYTLVENLYYDAIQEQDRISHY